ncbi:MAG: hypothetical protein R2822_28480 [Spirosomataceae bacterium]
MEKEAHILEVVKYLKSRGFQDIKANVEGYETPLATLSRLMTKKIYS